MKTFKIKVSYFNLGMGIEERQEYEIKARTERAATSKVYKIIGNRTGFITLVEQI